MWIPQRLWKISENCYILNTFSRSELQNFLLMRKCKFFVLFSYFFSLDGSKDEETLRGSWNSGLVGPLFQSLKKSWQFPFLQRHQTKSWQKQKPLLRCWRYQDTTSSLTILWNIWIFQFHTVKWSLERSRYTFSSFWRTVL